MRPTQHHHTGMVLAYVFGRRQDTVFLELKALLEPYGITRYFTDGWGAYERHVEAEQHTIEKAYPENREQACQLAHAIKGWYAGRSVLKTSNTHDFRLAGPSIAMSLGDSI